MLWRIPLAMIACALLLLLALPPIGFAPAGAVAAIPLLLLGAQIRPIFFVAVGPLTGFLAGKIASIPMLPNATHSEADSGWTMLGMTLFGLLLGVFSGLWSSVKHRSLLAKLGLAALIVLLEWFTLSVLPLHLGLTQYRSGIMLLSASVGGIWLVSFAMWFANLWLNECLENPKKRMHFGWAALLLLPAIPDSGDIRVAAIQTESMMQRELTEAHERVTDQETLVVWPELSAKQFIRGIETAPLTELSARSASFVTGFNDTLSPLPHNVAALFDSGKEVARYEKRKPFAAEVKLHTPGKRVVVADWRGTKVGLNICFDSCYPTVMRDTARAGAGIIALPTLDPNTPNGWIQSIHDAYGNFRAAELGVSIVRADIISHSSIITRFGGTQSRAGAAKEEVLYGRVASQPIWTVYKAVGDVFLWSCILILAAYLWDVIRRYDRSLA